jgi:hypothetical protein
MEIRDKIKHFFSFDRRLDCSGAPHSYKRGRGWSISSSGIKPNLATSSVLIDASRAATKGGHRAARRRNGR